ncbi:Gfo/Idh/MocA family oxidoreductase [Bengtsoniella intestinalis]|uniref:Gfo/Idh/MocA family protein n=1 Tax=Bengtsoniella intestinalis TaxID=3073143 RepID=UPI00391F1DA5
MERTIPFGVIGMGSQGAVYAKLLNDSEGKHFRLAALSSRSEEKRETYAKLYPDVAYFVDWKEMVASGAVEAVIIATPHKNHPELATYCMEHGVHVLLDKPAGFHSLEVSRMNDCANAHSDVAFGMMFNQRTNAIYQRAKEVIATGEMGKLRRVLWTTTNWWRPDRYYSNSGWRGSWGGEGGGVMMNQAAHQLDLWQWICGMPQKLYAKVEFGAHRDIVVDNDVTIVADFGDGVTGTFITCANDPLGVDRLELTLDQGKIVIEGSGKTGSIHRLKMTESDMNSVMPMEQVVAFIQGKPLGDLCIVEELTCAEVWGQQHSILIENFAQHIVSGTPLLSPGVEGLNSLQLANAALLSAWAGEEVTFPLDEQRYLDALNQAITKEGKYDVMR